MLPATDFVTGFACCNWGTSPLSLEPLFEDGALINSDLLRLPDEGRLQSLPDINKCHVCVFVPLPLRRTLTVYTGSRI